MRIIIIPTLQEKAEAWRDYRSSNFFLPDGSSNLLFWFNNDALLTVLLRNKIGWVKNKLCHAKKIARSSGSRCDGVSACHTFSHWMQL